MILIIKKGIQEAELSPILSRIKEEGLGVQINHGKDRLVLGQIGRASCRERVCLYV